MRGRKPIPSYLEPEPPIGLPDPPEHLNDAAKEQWAKLGGQLVELRLMTQVDVGQLALYCTAWARWAEAEEKLRLEGFVVITPNGYPVQSAYLAIANKAMEQMQRALLEFGMSPSARRRVSAGAPVTTPKARLEAVLSGKKRA